MDTPRFLHAADLHLGAPLLSLGRHLDTATSDRYRALARGALTKLVQVAIDQRVEFVVLAGDIYDEAHREVGAQVRFARALGTLHEAGIATYMVHGNHDPLVESYRPAAALPPAVTVFPAGEVTRHVVALADGSEVVVAGTSFGTARETANLARQFEHLDTGGRRCVGVLHANLEGTVGHDPYAPCSVDDLAAAPVHYWALGHVHLRTVSELGLHRWWAYPGNLQGRSTRASECGPKGALVVPFAEHGVARPEFVACDTLRFQRIEVDVTGAADVADALDLATADVEAAVADAGPVPLLVRLSFHGATAAHHGLREARDLLELCREHVAAHIGDGALLKVHLATRPAIDRDRLIERRDLLAAVLQQLDAVREQGPDAVCQLVLGDLDRLIDHSRTQQLINAMSSRSAELGATVLAAVEERLINELVEPS